MLVLIYTTPNGNGNGPDYLIHHFLPSDILPELLRLEGWEWGGIRLLGYGHVKL